MEMEMKRRQRWVQKVSKTEEKGRGGGVVVQTGLFSPFIISPITVVGVQLKATNSEVLILASKEDKDK